MPQTYCLPAPDESPRVDAWDRRAGCGLLGAALGDPGLEQLDVLERDGGQAEGHAAQLGVGAEDDLVVAGEQVGDDPRDVGAGERDRFKNAAALAVGAEAAAGDPGVAGEVE